MVLFLVSSLGASTLSAQATDSTQLRRFRVADARMQSGQFEEAIEILQQLYEESPKNASFYRKLKEAYESVKRYDDALRLVEEQMEGDPTPSLLSEKARLLYQKGAEKQAVETWEQAIATAPRRSTTYRIVYQTLVDIRRFKQAIDVLTEARTTLDNDALFRTELAYLYGLDGQHAAAMEEYVALLDQSPRRVSLVRNRLQTFVEQGEGIQSSIKVLSGAVEEHPLNPAYRELLAWLYMTTDDYDAAYDVYRALDRLEQRQGQALFSFAQKAADADQFEVATTAFQSILDRHGEAKVAPQAQRALGDAYREWAESTYGPAPVRLDSASRYDAARTAYQTFLDTYPTHEAAPAVRSQLGTLQLDVYRDLDAAQST
ncbi:MAG TPA: tetratricopeptide repeat protein, partial [Salinibacter sp.]|nr:tetratricopeptide repeat protein [Salinibacter sp.]